MQSKKLTCDRGFCWREVRVFVNFLRSWNFHVQYRQPATWLWHKSACTLSSQIANISKLSKAVFQKRSRSRSFNVSVSSPTWKSTSRSRGHVEGLVSDWKSKASVSLTSWITRSPFVTDICSIEIKWDWKKLKYDTITRWGVYDNNSVKWGWFIVPKRLNNLITTYSVTHRHLQVK